MKTTPKHFQLFKAECKKWIKAWGITDWKAFYSHEIIQEKDTNAQIVFYTGDEKAATIRLGKGIEAEDKIREAVRRSAFHETGHLLLADLETLALRRFTTKIEIDTAIHAVIHRLEHWVFDENMKP